jgi:hypothetical protein
MTTSELKTKYTAAELSSYPGDDELRFAAFAPRRKLPRSFKDLTPVAAILAATLK